MDDQEFKNKLTEDQYRVLREGATEPAFSGEYYKNTADGMYHCAACEAPLFSSETKYDSGSGWPSFYDVEAGGVKTRQDKSHGMVRTEIICANCESHLGHVFEDGPKEKTGKRFCVNSLALDFQGK